MKTSDARPRRCSGSSSDGPAASSGGSGTPGTPLNATSTREQRNALCTTYPPKKADDIAQNVDDSCSLLRALDESGRALGARCVTGSCAELEKCLVQLTPRSTNVSAGAS